MIVLLPPSEGKTTPTAGSPLDLSALSNPALNPAREQVLESLIRLCDRTPRKARTVLALSSSQQAAVTENAALATNAAAPAWQIYTGVLFGALDFAGLAPAQRRRATKRLLVTSSLFGVVRFDDVIPAYRLAGDTTLPRLGRIDQFWRQHLGVALADEISDELLIDMRSGTYVRFWPVPASFASRTLTVKIWQLGPNGSRNAVSHHNKATKGELARLLAAAPSLPKSRSNLVDFLRDHDWDAQLGVDAKLGHDRLDVSID